VLYGRFRSQQADDPTIWVAKQRTALSMQFKPAHLVYASVNQSIAPTIPRSSKAYRCLGFLSREITGCSLRGIRASFEMTCLVAHFEGLPRRAVPASYRRARIYPPAYSPFPRCQPQFPRLRRCSRRVAQCQRATGRRASHCSLIPLPSSLPHPCLPFCAGFTEFLKNRSRALHLKSTVI